MINRVNPDALPDSASIGYSQISVADAGRIAYVSGQVASKGNGEPAPDNITEQTKWVIANLSGALDALDANTEDIVWLRVYVVDLDDEKMAESFPLLLEFLNGSQPSLTGIGVSALADNDLMLEVEMAVQV